MYGRPTTASTMTSPAAISAARPVPSIGIAPAGTGSGGVATSRPVSPRTVTNAEASTNGAAAAAIHPSHGLTASWRRRTRAKPSIVTTTGASSSAPMSSRTAHAGSTLRRVTTSRVGAAFRSGPSSRATMLRSAARPKASSRPEGTVAEADGGRSPRGGQQHRRQPRVDERALLADRAREGEAGPLRHDAGRARARPGLGADRRLDRAPHGAAAPSREPSDQLTPNGRRSSPPPMSPSTSTASTGPVSRRARSRAPAAPPLPPLVETNVIVRRRRPPATTRASSSIAAVPDSSARAPRPAASRWATTTIPGRAGRPGGRSPWSGAARRRSSRRRSSAC